MITTFSHGGEQRTDGRHRLIKSYSRTSCQRFMPDSIREELLGLGQESPSRLFRAERQQEVGHRDAGCYSRRTIVRAVVQLRLEYSRRLEGPRRDLYMANETKNWS